ncbi:MAG: hypothetical protein V2I24_16700 [Halieaceae bacterium]|nr:hypothetical protein [Halieaceae bacterium]
MYTVGHDAVTVHPMEIQQTRELDLTPDYAIDEIDRISNEFEDIVRRLTATTEGDEREAVNLMLAHALTCASNRYDLCLPTTMKVVRMVAERMLGRAKVVGTRH